MSLQSSLASAIASLKKEEQRLERELAELRGKIGSLSGVTRAKGVRKSPGKRKLSAKGKAAISAAAKKRWAAWRKAQGKK